jgi:hypothetical protein
MGCSTHSNSNPDFHDDLNIVANASKALPNDSRKRPMAVQETTGMKLQYAVVAKG